MEGGEDRLSDLPDCILIHIMTFLITKDVVTTAILSRRWKVCGNMFHLLYYVPDFKFRRMKRFNEAVSKFLLLRDGSVPLLNVDLHHFSCMFANIQTSLSEYAVMQNVERLKLHSDHFLHLSPCVLSSQTLTLLDLSSRSRGFDLPPKILNMRALTSLHLKNFGFCGADNESLDPFSSCVKLKILVIEHCSIKHSKIFCISNATLVLSLTPELLKTGSPGLDKLQLLMVKLKNRSALVQKRHRATYFKKPDFKTTLVHAGVVDYLIRNSPFAEVNIVKR
ncbi:hypothetical protein PIB30_050903 [Stylosanthes scabra]|uniref:F-box domain-containing protein n=1 Tax=Stylosanthes scabra TaxID=79078 RepID=A0ABU6XFK4_9FABA|nr:hypothetical protein [Stylosanthes scabra]